MKKAAEEEQAAKKTVEATTMQLMSRLQPPEHQHQFMKLKKSISIAIESVVHRVSPTVQT